MPFSPCRRGLLLGLGFMLVTTPDLCAQRRLRPLPVDDKPLAFTGPAMRTPAPIGFNAAPLTGPGSALTGGVPIPNPRGTVNNNGTGGLSPFQQSLYNASPGGPGPFNPLYQNSYFNNPFPVGGNPLNNVLGNPYLNGVYPTNFNQFAPTNSNYWPTQNFPGH